MNRIALALALAASTITLPAEAQRLPYVAPPGTPAEVIAADRFTREIGFMVFNGAMAEHCGQRSAQWRRVLMDGVRLEIRNFATHNGTAYLSREAIVFLGLGKIAMGGELAAEVAMGKQPGDCSGITDEASLQRADDLVNRLAGRGARQ